jgi:hypothetical protein
MGLLSGAVFGDDAPAAGLESLAESEAEAAARDGDPLITQLHRA